MKTSQIILDPEVEKRLKEKDEIFNERVALIKKKRDKQSSPYLYDSGEKNVSVDERLGR